MDVVSAFFDEHFIAIYFFYGLSFFSMGLTLLVVSRRDSKLSLAQCVHWLGIFGLIHGTHEFAEMFELIGEFPPTPWLNLSLTLLLAISFLPLLTFGFALLKRNSGYVHRCFGSKAGGKHGPQIPVERTGPQRCFSIVVGPLIAGCTFAPAFCNQATFFVILFMLYGR